MLRYDLLGAVKYPKKAIAGVKPNSAIAVLDGVFHEKSAPHNKLYRNILQSDKQLTLVVHCNWSSAHIYSQSHKNYAIKVVKRLKKLADKIPGSHERIYVSPYLESRGKFTFLDQTFKQLREIEPNFNYINCILAGGEEVPGVLTEIHNIDYEDVPSKYIWSFDGWDYREHSVKQYLQQHKEACMFGLWAPVFNGRKSMGDTTPPLKRVNWPSIDDIRQATKAYRQARGA